MKVLKKVSLILILGVSILLLVFNNNIYTFAESITESQIQIGRIFKNGDVVHFSSNIIDPCEHGISSVDCRRYSTIQFNYYDENNNSISSYSLYDFNRNNPDQINNFVVSNDYSEYWKIVYLLGISSNFEIFLQPVVYEEPSFSLTCNPKEIKDEECSECTLSTKYFSKFKSLSFKIGHDDYELFDFAEGDSFTDIEVTDDTYKMLGKYDMEESPDGVEKTVAKFKVRSLSGLKNNNMNNIKIEELEYEDDYERNTYNLLTDTVNVTIEENEIIEVPNTERKTFLIISSFIGLLSLVAVLLISTVVKKKNKY